MHEYNCVRNAFLRAGFKRTNGSGWNALWAKHLTEEQFLRMTPYQKANHFPGTWGIGRKDRLARNLSRMKRDFGKKYHFSVRTFYLPNERMKLQMEMDADPKVRLQCTPIAWLACWWCRHSGCAQAIWILKPAASSCGRGIKLVSGQAHSKLPKKRKLLAQHYIRNPLLINGHKWDLRMYVARGGMLVRLHTARLTSWLWLWVVRRYVLVTSFDPLRVYLFDNGLTRFCTEKYTVNHKTLKNRFAHLTNYSVNKHSDKFLKNEDPDNDMYGSKWSFKALMRYFKQNDMPGDTIRDSIKDVVIKTLLSIESDVGSLSNRYFPNRYAMMWYQCVQL